MESLLNLASVDIVVVHAVSEGKGSLEVFVNVNCILAVELVAGYGHKVGIHSAESPALLSASVEDVVLEENLGLVGLVRAVATLFSGVEGTSADGNFLSLGNPEH